MSREAIEELCEKEPLFQSAGNAEARAYLEREGHQKRLQERRKEALLTARREGTVTKPTCAGASAGDCLSAQRLCARFFMGPK